MPFESTERVKFHNNPLIEVVAQLNFASLVEDFLADEKLVELHTLISSKLPLFNKNNNVSLHVNADKNSVTQEIKPIYEFSTIDGLVKAIISQESLVIATTSYTSKEDFFGYLDFVYDAVKKVGVSEPFSRLGLRHKDVIQKNSLGEDIKASEWTELIRNSLVSMFMEKSVSSEITGTQSSFALKLNDIDKNAHMNVSYGLVSNANTGEPCFLIDSDFFIEGRVFEYADARDLFNKGNVKSRDFFQWCLKPKLFNALKPESIPE